MVNQQETDRRMYAETLDWAERSGNTGVAQRLRESGPPPSEDMLAYPDALSSNPELNAHRWSEAESRLGHLDDPGHCPRGATGRGAGRTLVLGLVRDEHRARGVGHHR